MSYAYYRNDPRWGTQQYQFAPPPAPTFQPQPGWGGFDYYRAAAINADPAIYDYAWNRIRDGGASGLGFYEARHWHRIVYGGLGELNMMLPADLGAAAAYEAYRNWIHNTSLYEPLNADDERQREAMVGLAIAEATRLWQGAGRAIDRYGLQLACETAAATANHIMSQWSRPDYSASPALSHSDAYALDNALPYRGRRRRQSSLIVSPTQAPTVIIGGNPSPYGGYAVTTPYAGSNVGTYGGYGGGYPAANYGHGAGYPGGFAGAGYPGSLPGSGYAGSMVGGYAGGALGGGYANVTTLPPGGPYSSALPNVGGIVPFGNPPPLVLRTPSYDRHHHHHHHRRRSHSRESERERREYRRERRYSDVGVMGGGGLMSGLAAGGVGPGFAGYGTNLLGVPGVRRYGGSTIGSYIG